MDINLETVRERERERERELHFIKIKERNGITLISLVITIIILLILAGITISQLTGNGLFEKATEAKEKSLKANVKEDIILAIYEIQMDYQKNGKILERDNLNQELLEEKNKNISRYGEIDTYSGIYQTGKQSIKFTIKEDLSVIIEEDLEINNDIRKWLQYANLDNKYDYTKIDEILLDDICMQELFNSKEAVDYMTTNNKIINAIAQNEKAMKILGNSKYASYSVIKNDKTKDIILSSVYSEEFNNGNLISPNLNGYVNNLTYSSCNSDTWAAWKVFDRNQNTQWGTNNNVKLPNWIQYNLEKEYLIYKVVVVNAYQTGMGPQSGNVYINGLNIGNYDVKTEKEAYNINCFNEGSIIKVTCDKYNWQSVQSYLSEIYVYGVEIYNEDAITIPALTDNTSNGIVTGSPLYSGAYQLYSLFTQGEPNTASGTNIWCPRPYNNSWIAYEFNIEKDINIYKLKFNSYAETGNSSRWFFPKKYVLQCKINDGDDGEMSNWVDCSPIYEISDITSEGTLVTNISESNKWYTVTNYFNSNVYGKKFRLYVYESSGNDLNINGLQIYGRE